MITPVNTNYPRIVHSKNNVSLIPTLKFTFLDFIQRKPILREKYHSIPPRENITEETDIIFIL